MTSSPDLISPLTPGPPPTPSMRTAGLGREITAPEDGRVRCAGILSGGQAANFGIRARPWRSRQMDDGRHASVGDYSWERPRPGLRRRACHGWVAEIVIRDVIQLWAAPLRGGMTSASGRAEQGHPGERTVDRRTAVRRLADGAGRLGGRSPDRRWVPGGEFK